MSFHLFFLHKTTCQLWNWSIEFTGLRYILSPLILALTNSLISPISAARGCEKFCCTEHWHSILPDVPDVPISALYLVPDALYLADVGAQRLPNCVRCANESQSIQCNDSTLATRRWQILQHWSLGFNPAWCFQCVILALHLVPDTFYLTDGGQCASEFAGTEWVATM